MDCVITAGGVIGPDDPLYIYSQGRNKALIDINGRPMLAYVIDALQGSRYVDTIVIVGLAEPLDESVAGPFQRPIYYLPDQGGLISNVLAGANWVRQNNPRANQMLVSSSDIPSITPEIIDQFVDACRPFDHALYYAFVTQEVMEARFPHSNRTFVRLGDVRVAGGDLIVGSPALAESNVALFEALTNARKHAWKLARLVGLGTLIKLLLRRLTLADIEAMGPRLIGQSIKAILSPHAELAMDADKPGQIDLLRDDLARRRV